MRGKKWQIGGLPDTKMKHNERISPEARIVYPDHFLFSTIKDGKTWQCCTFYFSILHPSLSTSYFLFVFFQKCLKRLKTFLGDLFLSRSETCCLSKTSNIQPALLWHGTDLGQRLISLSLLTNPGPEVCIWLAFRPQWFNKLCLIWPKTKTLISRHTGMILLSAKLINHTWAITQQERDSSYLGKFIR